MNSPNLTTVPLPPAKGRSIGRNRADRALGRSPKDRPPRQNWGKFKAHKWGGFTGRLDKSRETNSVPWSTRIVAGNPISRPTLSNTSTTSTPRKEKRGSNASEKRENVSTIVSTQSLRPVASWSWIKSITQVSFGRVALHRSSRSFALTRRFGVLLRNCRPNLR